ncbi:MAG: DEAD/DEAH box helicase [bacterium]|nr:DEAD/DEAH box helicase [bacterium]
MSLGTGTQERRSMATSLRRVWGAFYGRFYEPRSIQFQAIQPLLRGENVLLASCTASGKTEAYLAPLTERWLEPMQRGELCLAIVCPTRALANDLVKRITGPLERCRIKILLRTGDHPTPLNSRKCGVLVTTLESLDSLLCRHASNLLSIKALVLEELHVAEGTARGDQLAVLVSRLDTLLHCDKAREFPGTLGQLGLPMQRLAVTATPGNAEIIKKKYLAGLARFVEAGPPGNFHVELRCPSDTEAWDNLEISAARALAFLRCCVQFCLDKRCRKMLVFVRSRAEAELLVASKKYLTGSPFGEAFFSHHSSLGTEQRERVEKLFAERQYAICFATSTLEVGIDIGDVDAVALTAPPADLNSFLQRIGRSGRRHNIPFVLGLYETEFERYQYEHLILAAVERRRLSDHPPFLSSVLIQQSVSLACQNPKHFIDSRSLYSRLPAYLRDEQHCCLQDCQKILQSACEGGWLESSGHTPETYVLSARALEAFDRGETHHNITKVVGGRAQIAVVDKLQGRTIGVLSGKSNFLPGDCFYIGGTGYRVLGEVSANQLSVAREEHPDPRRLRSCNFASSGLPKSSEPWTSDFAKFLQFPPDCSVWVQCDTREIIYSHFMGTVGSIFLRCICTDVGIADVKVNDYVLVCSQELKLPSSCFNGEALKVILRHNASQLADRLDLGPWSSCLSDELLEKEVLKLAWHVRLLEHLQQFKNLQQATIEQARRLYQAAALL